MRQHECRDSRGARIGWAGAAIIAVSAYWYLDEAITVLAEPAPDLAEAQIGDITRAALVLTRRSMMPMP